MASRYWVGDVVLGDNWNNANAWAAVSGGAGGAGVPVIGDDVFFDALSVRPCTVNINNPQCLTFDCNGFANTIAFTVGASTLTVSGLLFRLVAGMTWTHNNNLTVSFTAAAGVVAITMGGKSFYNVSMGGASTKQQQDALVADGTFTFAAGVYQTQGFALTSTGRMTWAAGLAVNSFQAGASIVTLGENLNLDSGSVMQLVAAYGTSQFRFIGTGSILGTPAALRSITFFNLYVAAPGKAFTQNIAGSSTITIKGQVTTGSGTATWVAGQPIYFNGTGAVGGVNPLLPDPACTWKIPISVEVDANLAVTNLNPCNYNLAGGSMLWRKFSAAGVHTRLILTGNITITTTAGNYVDFSSNALALADSALDLNGFNLTINSDLSFGRHPAATYSAPMRIVAGNKTIQVSGSVDIAGQTGTVPNYDLVDLRGGGSIICGGSFTLQAGNTTPFKFRMDGNCLISVGGNWTVNAVSVWNALPGINNVLRFTGAGALTIAPNVVDLLPTVQFTGACAVTLINGWNSYDLQITNAAASITAGNPFTVRNVLTNNGTFTGSANMFIGSGFVNTGTVIGAGTNIITTGAVFRLAGFNPLTLSMGPTTIRMQLESSMNIGTLIIQNRSLPGIIQCLAGGTFNVTSFNSQVGTSDGVIQVVSSVAGTRYRMNMTGIASMTQIWPRDWDASASPTAPAGDITNKDLGNNLGWTLSPSYYVEGKVVVISEDCGQDLLAAGGIGPFQYCWLVDTTLVGLTAKATAFGTGSTNWHRKTNIPFAALDNLVKGTTYFIGLGIVDARNQRLAPNVGAGDYATGMATNLKGEGGGAHSIVVSPQVPYM